ncbi:hypothetical protein DXM21_21580 [Agrobacterium rosae]|nr:hypothetical protein DXM21_21580 [Agrobacterium rosae]KAA3516557.1 hypothetical protein DXM25_19785 [Agrobacterium rosae]MQB50361.1 hypothetical protein [Agrobacterium rosae]
MRDPLGPIPSLHPKQWAVQRSRFMTRETIGQMSDDPIISLPAASGPIPGSVRKARRTPKLQHAIGHDHRKYCT